MMSETLADLHSALMSLILTWLGEGPSLQRDLDRILNLAQRPVPGCDAGSVTLIVEGQPQTEAVIDRVVVAVDVAECEVGEGPSVRTAAETRPIRVDLIPTDERFPRWAERVDPTGVQSPLCLPVVVGGVAVGILNLYSWRPFLLDSTSVDLGAVLAAQVGVAVARSRLLADSQQVAVAAQRLADEDADVAVAQGMLMGLEDCTPEQAGALIRNAAACEAETMVGIARRILAAVKSQDRRAGSPADRRNAPDP
jgi:GAF domain-containing protein